MHAAPMRLVTLRAPWEGWARRFLSPFRLGFFIPGVVLWSARNSLDSRAGAAGTARPAA